ncbi:hypothetical protein ACFV3R_15045 [Streptomyces sp. NPDC059740]|uniref:hypothetical protein n=1 Tax=Streptomyces sp. NPDC059740 TaxID=3346926 RepID=UPI00365AD37B
MSHTDLPPLRAEDIPDGVQEVFLPDGRRALAYTTPSAAPTVVQPEPAPGPPAPPPAPAAAAVPVAQPIPAWVKSTALLAPTLGGGVAVSAVGLSVAAPGLDAASHALWSLVALLATGGGAAALLLSRVRARLAAAQRAAERPHITQNITATGLFGRANGTINHR